MSRKKNNAKLLNLSDFVKSILNSYVFSIMNIPLSRNGIRICICLDIIFSQIIK